MSLRRLIPIEEPIERYSLKIIYTLHLRIIYQLVLLIITRRERMEVLLVVENECRN